MKRNKVEIKVSAEIGTILQDLFNQIGYEVCKQYEEEIERLNNIIKKAINYIENEDIDVCSIRNNDIQDTKQELLDILKGE